MNITDYISDDARAQKLFRLLPPEELQQLPLQTLKKGERLISMGDTANALYIIMRGICNMERNTDVNCRQPQPPLGYLDVVGLYEIIHNVPRFGTVVACGECCAAVVSKKVALRWVDEYPRFMLELSTGIIQRLFGELDHIDQYAKLPVYYGVVSVVLAACEMLRREMFRDTWPIKITYTRQNIADMTGKDIRTVNRAVDRLKKQGTISIIKGKIVVSQEQEQLLRLEKANAGGA